MSNKTKFYKVDVNEINIYSKLARVLNRKFDTNKLEVFHVVYDESGFISLEGDIQNGYVVEVMLNGEKDKKYSVDLIFDDEEVRNTKYAKNMREVIKLIEGFIQETMIWTENGENNKEAMEKVRNAEISSIRDSMELHNMLIDSFFKVNTFETNRILKEKGIRKDDYFYKDRVFYNKNTLKPVYSYK